MVDLIAKADPILALVASTEGEPKPLIVGVDLLLFTLVIFLVLLWVLRKFAWSPIAQGLDKREAGIADQIEKARVAHEKAQATLETYEQRLATAADKANQLLIEAKKEAENARAKIVAEASAEAKRQRDRAIADINAAKDQAVRELAERSVNSALSLAGSLVAKELDRTSHAKLIQDSLEQFTQKA